MATDTSSSTAIILRGHIQEDTGAPGVTEGPAWMPERYPETFLDGSPDWRRRIQSCIREHGRVLFSAMYEVRFGSEDRPTPEGNTIVLKTDLDGETRVNVPNQVVEGLGPHTGVRLADGDPWVNRQERFWMFGPAVTTDRFDDCVFRDFTVDFGTQPNHNTTLNAISLVGDRSRVEDVRVIGGRAGNRHEAFLIKCVSQDRNVDPRGWETVSPLKHCSVVGCSFDRPQANNEQDEDEGRKEVPEITCVWADIANHNRFNVQRDALQRAPVHCITPNAANAATAVGNRCSAKGVRTILWTQQPGGPGTRNQVFYDNLILP